MEELKAQLTELEAQKAKLFEDGNADQVAVSRLNEKIKAVQAQLSQIAQDMHVETVVAEAQAQVTQSFDTISAGDQTMTLGDLAVNESARQILSIYFSQYVTNLTEQHAKEIGTMKASYDSQISDVKAESDRIQTQYDSLYEQSNALRITNAQQQIELTDMTARRDAAAAELESEKKETARLNSQVDDLRAEMAVGARVAVQVVTNTNADLGEMMRQFNEAKPAIYDIRWKDDRIRNRYIANLAETGEEFEFPYLEKGKYREVTAEEAERFRAEQASQPEAPAVEADPTEQVETPVPSIEPPALPSDEAVPAEELNTVPTNSTDGEVVPKTLEERVKALEEAVFVQSKVEAAA